MTAGFFALAGALIGALAPLLTERFRAHRESERQRREALRSACAGFTAALIRIRHLSVTLTDDASAEALRRIEAANEEAWIEFERVRMLSESQETQEAGRHAVRHIYAVRKLAETGTDPRGTEYPGTTPSQRFNRKLEEFYVAVRRELGIPDPEAVFPELEG